MPEGRSQLELVDGDGQRWLAVRHSFAPDGSPLYRMAPLSLAERMAARVPEAPAAIERPAPSAPAGTDAPWTPQFGAVLAPPDPTLGRGQLLRRGLRSTDPRIFAVGYDRDIGGPADRGWTRASAAHHAAILLHTSIEGRKLPARERVEWRQLGTPNYGFLDSDLDRYWIFRVTTDRAPAQFDLSTMAGLPVDLQHGAGVVVYVADRTRPRPLRKLPPVATLVDGGAS